MKDHVFFYFDRRDPSPAFRVDIQETIRRLKPFCPPDKSGFLEKDRALLIQALQWNTASSHLEPCPLRHDATNTAVVSWARIDNRKELAESLGISAASLCELCDSELILQSYLKWEEDCVCHLIGDFSFVIYDGKREKVFCGRDHMGVRPFYYFASEDAFICSTNLDTLRHLESIPIHIDEQWIAEYLLQLSMSFDRTPYNGIRKLPPAHCLTFTEKESRLRQYFKLSAEPSLRLKDSREYVEAYREQMETAVRCRLESNYAIGSELSGGVDSSTITAYAAKFLETPSRLHAFAFAFSELEPQHIMAVSQACRILNNHVFTGQTADPREVLLRSLDILGYPVEHPNATIHESFYRLAENLGIRTLLSGFGGDEFGTTIHGNLVPLELLMQRRFDDLYDRLPGNPLFRFLRLIKLELTRRKTQNFKKPEYNPRFFEGHQARWPHRIVRDEWIRQYDLESRYFDEARMDAGYTNLKSFTLDKRWRPFIPTRMENCSLMAAARGIEYRWPLLDIRLVRLFLSIPSEENYYRGTGRYLHRRAIQGTVPDMVAWKRGKDMGAFAGQGHLETDHLLQFSLSDLHPSVEQYIHVEKLREQIDQFPSLLHAGLKNTKLTQIKRNIKAVAELSAWMNHIERN